MTYPEVLSYLFKQLPMYQRIGAAAYKSDLANTHALMQLLGNPESNLTCIHVAGTNGKGSVCHMLASVFQEKGLKVGLYTSPHLIDFRERIRINGNPIPEEIVVEFVNEYMAKFENIGLSFFEWTVGLCFWYFREQETDIAIIETGMGGRLDSTNVVNPLLSVITNISFDHMQFLGNTLEKIAGEKAGIIKPNVPVLIGRKQAETTKVFEQKANLAQSQLLFAEDVISEHELLHESAGYQKENRKTVLAALKMLEDSYSFSKDQVEQGIRNVSKNTGLLGRWTTISENPKVICDVGHNEEGIQRILELLKAEKYQRLFIVWGTLRDKDQDKILTLLPREAHYFWCQASIERSLPAEELNMKAQEFKLKGEVVKRPISAYKSALEMASTTDLIFIGGSTFVVADFFLEYKSKM